MSVVGIETGGTKIVCSVAPAHQPNRPTRTVQFPTSTPTQTFAQINDFIQRSSLEDKIEALGVASFGPVDTDPLSDRFGWITSTPKPGWRHTDVLSNISLATHLPTAFLHDVRAAALGEQRWGAALGSSNAAYATVGTGIGVGLIVADRLLGGAGWPEIGHMTVKRHPTDPFSGNCPYHGDCLEGLAAGPAVLARWGGDASSLPGAARGSAIEILGYYIAQLVHSTALMLGTNRMVVGGGVMHTPGLLQQVRLETATLAAGYGPSPLADEVDVLVRAPELGETSGVVGAACAAADLLRR